MSKSPLESFEYSSPFSTISNVVGVTSIGEIPAESFTLSSSVPESLILTNDSILLLYQKLYLKWMNHYCRIALL